MGQDPKELTLLQSYLIFKIYVLYFHLAFEVLKRMNILNVRLRLATPVIIILPLLGILR